MPRILAIAVVLIVTLAPGQARGEAPATAPAVEAMRYVENDDGTAALQASVHTFGKGDATVTLFAAVHIGDRAYYDGLNTAFKDFEVVLYEMVKPRDMAPPPPGQFGGGGGINLMQRAMQNVTGLQYQLDIIDYTRPNFVHADMDFETFADAMAERNEVMRLIFRAMTAGSQTQTHPDVLLGQFMLAAQDPAEAVHLKRMLAREFANLDQMLKVLEGPDGSVLLNERNKAAIDVLRQQLRRGRRNLALFYGAAHVPDLAERLVDLGFEPVKTEWRVAWAIDAPPPPPATQPVGQQ